MSITTISIAALVLLLASALTLLLFRRSGISSMSLLEFSRRLLKGWRTPSIGPEHLREMRRRLGDEVLIIDLRPTKRFTNMQIPGAISRPFDDFLKEMVVDRKYDGDRSRPLVFVCDTGQMSRVAADIMIKDEGFSKVYNLRGGMKAWRRSQENRVCWCRLSVPTSRS